MANERVQKGSGLWLEGGGSIDELTLKVVEAFFCTGPGVAIPCTVGAPVSLQAGPIRFPPEADVRDVVQFVAEQMGYQKGQPNG